MWLTIAHVPGVENCLADFISRNFQDNLEWSLGDRLFDRIVQCFGHPQIDLFASRLNKKVDRYVAWTPDPGAFAIDAFSIDWSCYFFYAFPLFSVVSRAIEKILEEEAEGILVVPHWATRPWWGRLSSLHLRKIQFRPKKGNLVPIGNPENGAMLSRSPLVAYRFSQNLYSSKGLTKLP